MEGCWRGAEALGDNIHLGHGIQHAKVVELWQTEQSLDSFGHVEPGTHAAHPAATQSLQNHLPFGDSEMPTHSK
jgi:hypothetical protein